MTILLSLLPLLAPILGQILTAIEGYFLTATVPATTETVLGDVAAIVDGVNKDYPTADNATKHAVSAGAVSQLLADNAIPVSDSLVNVLIEMALQKVKASPPAA